MKKPTTSWSKLSLIIKPIVVVDIVVLYTKGFAVIMLGLLLQNTIICSPSERVLCSKPWWTLKTTTGALWFHGLVLQSHSAQQLAIVPGKKEHWLLVKSIRIWPWIALGTVYMVNMNTGNITHLNKTPNIIEPRCCIQTSWYLRKQHSLHLSITVNFCVTRKAIK